MVVECILLFPQASVSILPKPLQLEGAAYGLADEGGGTGKESGKSPGQHGAKLMITSVLSLSLFAVEQIQK